MLSVKIHVIFYILFLCILCYTVSGRGEFTKHIEENEIRYAFGNDNDTSIAVCVGKREPLVYKEEWAMVVCVTLHEPRGCDFSTTNTSSLTKVVDAVSKSLNDFQHLKPNAHISHIYCSPFLTIETRDSFINRIGSSQNRGDKAYQLERLKNCIVGFGFEPLTGELNKVLKAFGYMIVRIESLDVSEMMVGTGYPTIKKYVEHLKTEHSYFYLELDGVL